MAALVDHTVPLGDGTVQVFTRTPRGLEASIVVGHDKLNTPELYAMLSIVVRRIDDTDAALEAVRYEH